MRGIDPNVIAFGNLNDEYFEKDERELDYEDISFLNNESVDTLLDVYYGIWKPYLVHEMFEGCEYL